MSSAYGKKKNLRETKKFGKKKKTIDTNRRYNNNNNNTIAIANRSVCTAKYRKKKNKKPKTLTCGVGGIEFHNDDS